MGEISTLTKEQKIILGEVGTNEFLKSQFYFTGGTALSTFYLQHRESEDLDFFSRNKFNNQVIFTIVDSWSKKHKFKFQSRFNEVVYIFILNFKGNTTLKVDFGYYPYQVLNGSKIKDGVKIDSLLDIAVNKLLTIQQRTDVKDFVDLYYLLDKFTIWDLIEGVRHKFKVKIEPFLLSGDFMKVNQFENLPKMIRPLELDKLKSFFINKAQRLGKMATKI